MQVSVIIAVYNRASILPLLLEQWRIVDQFTYYEYELIFSDDESTDESVAILEAATGLPMKVIKNKHGGAAKARNHAYQYATGEIVIFTGDDIFPTNNFVNEHYESYLNNGKNIAMLGRIDWKDGIQMNHLMKHITDIGCEQFGFVGMKPHDFVDFRHFYTSNISVSREKLQELDCLFDQTFKKYGFEDIELGYRLYKNGVKILYNPNALAYHDHVYASVDRFCDRQKSAGEELNTFKRLHPGMRPEEIKLDLDEFHEQYDRYVMSNKIIDLLGDTSRLMIFVMKQCTKILEKALQIVDHNAIRKICSYLYRVIFKYYMYLGIAYGGKKGGKYSNYKAQRFVIRYLLFGKSQIFYDVDNHFTEEGSVKYHTSGEKYVNLKLNMQDKPIGRIRLDPLDRNCKVELQYARAYINENSFEDISFEFTNATSHSEGIRYNFSTVADPILISTYLPVKTTQIEIQLRMNYLLPKRIWGVFKRTIPLFVKVVAKSIKYLRKRLKNEGAGLSELRIVDHKEKRYLWITIDGPDQDLNELIHRYQSICMIFKDVQIQAYESDNKKYEEYVYRITDVKNAIDPIQFMNAVFGLLLFQLDYMIVSDGLDYFPQVLGSSLEDTLIFSKKYMPVEDGLKDAIGKMIRIPGIRRLQDRFNLLNSFPELKTISNIVYNDQLREIRFNRQIEMRRLQKQKPLIFVLPVFMAVGGVERNTIEIMDRLQDDYDFVVITFESHRHEQGSLFYQVAELCLSYIDLAEISSFDYYLYILEIIKYSYDPNLIWICNSSPWTMENSKQLRLLFNDIPIVVQDVYDYNYGWIEYYNRPEIQSYDRFIAINRKIRDKFITTNGIKPDIIDLVYSAVDTDKIKDSIALFDRMDVLKKHNLNPEKQHFAFIGRFTEQKQPLKVFELAKYVVESHNNVDFVMVGDGELSVEVEDHIEKFGLGDRIHRIKYIPTVSEFIKAIDGLVIVSLFEGLPIVMIEAMCIGTPVLSTDVGDVAFFVNENHNGVIAKSHAIDDIKWSFDQLYADLNKYKTNARESIQKSTSFFSSQRSAGLMKESFKRAEAQYQFKVREAR